MWDQRRVLSEIITQRRGGVLIRGICRRMGDADKKATERVPIGGVARAAAVDCGLLNGLLARFRGKISALCGGRRTAFGSELMDRIAIVDPITVPR